METISEHEVLDVDYDIFLRANKGLYICKQRLKP